ncbi:MAG: winged helix-turn-helix transcriptional regulator [Candidatus Heimdallarchaeota archaeon]|nr:winged helix-turn-helix transcriptional regulator [Candidatus Heimdallarchaeota archaeon]
MTFDLDRPTLLISSIGDISEDKQKSLFFVAKRMNVEKLILVNSYDQEIQNKYDEITEHFKNYDVQVILETLSLENFHTEYLYLSKTIAEQISSSFQIVIDCNIGPRYLRPIIIDAVNLIKNLSFSLFKTPIQFYEAIRHENSKKVYYYAYKNDNLLLHAFKVLMKVEQGTSEADIGDEVGIKQSTVNSHLKMLRKLGLIEGVGKKQRKKSIKGEFIKDIALYLESNLELIPDE